MFEKNESQRKMYRVRYYVLKTLFGMGIKELTMIWCVLIWMFSMMMIFTWSFELNLTRFVNTFILNVTL